MVYNFLKKNEKNIRVDEEYKPPLGGGLESRLFTFFLNFLKLRKDPNIK